MICVAGARLVVQLVPSVTRSVGRPILKTSLAYLSSRRGISMAFSTEERGSPNSLEYRVFFSK